MVKMKKVLKKPIEAYRTIPPHVIAAKKLRALGIPVKPGMVIEFEIVPTACYNSLMSKLPKCSEKYPI